MYFDLKELPISTIPPTYLQLTPTYDFTHGTLFGLITGEIFKTEGFINILRFMTNFWFDSCPALKKGEL